MAYIEYIGFTVVILLIIKIYIKLTNGKCTSKCRLEGKTAIVTGANTGIGKIVAMDLASRGARVILACRNKQTGAWARGEIIGKSGNKNIVLHELNLESLDSIRRFSKEIHDTESRLDILVNNAGAGGLGNKFTEDGLHIGMQVNHLGPFLLTNLLLDLLKKSAPSRIIVTSSLAHRYGELDPSKLNTPFDSDLKNYSNSKLCNLLMSNELARKLEGTEVTCNSLHPGAVKTELFRHMPEPLNSIWQLYASLYFKSPEEGAQTTIYLAVAEEVKNITGKYFAECMEKTPSKKALDEGLAKKVWDASEELVKLQLHEKYY